MRPPAGTSICCRAIERVLVTGGAGFIGSHIARRLLEDGHSVRVLDNFATGRRSNLRVLDDAAEVVEGDIQSYERVSRAVTGCEAVLHEAALPSVPRSIQDPLTSNATNVIGTLNVLLAARDHGVRRVVLASSSSVYGTKPRLPKQEDDPALPISPYASTKLAGESYARSFHNVYGLETVMLRYFNVFGPLVIERKLAGAVPKDVTPNRLVERMRGATQIPTVSSAAIRRIHFGVEGLTPPDAMRSGRPDTHTGRRRIRPRAVPAR